LSGSGSNGVGVLTWNASPEPVVGYHVYRSAFPKGSFIRLTSSPVTATSFTDSSDFAASVRTYMVRAVALQINPSGSYFNPSQGIFVNVDVGVTPPLPAYIVVSAELTSGGIQLTWESQLGISYHVKATAWLDGPNWTDISGPITSASSSASFLDRNWDQYSTRFYRILSE
jgi:hypothetical protein